MIRERKEKQSKDYQFLNERIVPKRKKKWLKRFGTMMFILCMAIVFGVAARAAYLLSGDYLKTLFGVEDRRQEVKLSNSFASVPDKTPTPKLTPTNTPEIMNTATNNLTLAPTQGAELTLKPTMEPEAVQDEKDTSEQQEGTEGSLLAAGAEAITEKTAISSYLQIYKAIQNVAQEVSDAFVMVEAIEQGVDWFQEVYEKRTRTTGLVLGNDGVDLLILVGTEQLAGANEIDVFFGEEFVSGRIYSMDRDYGLAVVAVPLNQISENLLEHIEMGVLAEAKDMVIGTPVIALGAPNGYEGSMEIGMITSLGGTVSVTDGEVDFFTANITEYPTGYGFVVNLEGKILGLITHTHKANPEDGIFTAVSLDSIRGVIVKLLNNVERLYFGIKGENIPQNLKKEYGLEHGVYVREVENTSPALAAGIKAGDILVDVAGTPVEGIHNFAEVLLERNARENVQVKLLRKIEDGFKEITIDVILSKKK